MQDIYTKIFTSRKFWKIFIPVFLFVLVSSGLFLMKNEPQIVEASWWNDSWSYRKSIQITNSGSAESNVYASTTLFSIATSSIQSDCGDFRFTSEYGEVLDYYIVSGCGTATTTLHVNFESFKIGTQYIYFYYGNPSAENGFSVSDFTTEASNYTVGIIGSEEIGGGPVGYWSFDVGYGSTVYDGSSGGNDGTIAGATWKDESMCVSGKCLYFDGENDELNMGSGSSIDGVFEDGGSINFWVKLSGWGELDPIIINKASNGTAGGWRFNIATSSGYFYFEQNHNSGAGEWRTGNNFVELNKWYNISLNYNSSNTANVPEIHINGVSQNLTVLNSPFGTADSDDADELVIGNNSGPGTDYSYEGYLDEVKIYPYARTSNQIKQDYNAGLAGIGSNKGTSVSFGSQSDSWMSDGLVGYWKMDETATTSGAIDSSGIGNNGTYEGTASTTGGKFGNGGVFDGTAGINLTDQDFYSPAVNDLSVSFWAKVPTTASARGNGTCGSTGRYFVAKDLSGNAEWGFENDNNNLLCFDLWQSGGQDHATIRISRTVNDGAWHHYVGIVDYLDEMKIYIDGELSGSNESFVNTMSNGNQTVRIGRRGDGNMLIGKLDEVRIYNRALSKTEVRKLYEWAPGPIMHLKMDEKQGVTAYDSSSYENNGTLINTPIWDRGKYGSAINFNKSNDYVEVTNSTSITLKNYLTIQLWIKPHALPTSDWTAFVEKGNYSTGYLFATGSGSMRDLSLWYAGTSIVDSNEVLIIGEWQNIAVTYDGVNAIIYHNGINVKSSAFTNTTTGNSNNINIARSPTWGSTRNFNGVIDDVRIYNYARTQKQILEDMSARGGSASGGNATKFPIAYWRFDEGYGATVHDESGRGNDGIASSSDSGANVGVSDMWSLEGKFNVAMEFDGVSDFVEIANNSVLDITGDEITLSTWVNPSAPGQSDFSRFISKRTTGGGTDVYALGLGPSEYSPVFRIRTSAVSTDLFDYSNIVIPQNEWSHIVGVYNGTKMKIFVNGEERLSGLKTGNIESSTVNVHLGDRKDEASNRRFDGLMDETKIFNYALSEDEIKQEYNQGSAAVFGSTGTGFSGEQDNSSSRVLCVPGDDATCSGPILELKLDEKQGSTAYDTSGNGNDGTINGALWSRGFTGAGLNMDGTDDYIEILEPTNDIFDWGTASTTEFTLSTWIKTDIESCTSDTTEAIVSRHDTNTRWWLGCRYDNKATFTVRDSNSDSLEIAYGGPVLNDNEWHNVVAVYDNLDMYIYVDGQVATSGTAVLTGNLDSAGDIYIGRYNALYNGKGIYDNIRIYDYARTPAQIAWEYNKGAPIAEWRFDEGSGSVIHDESGLDNDGILSTSTWETASCKLGKCLNLGSADGQVLVPNSTILNPKNISISGWVKTSTTTGTIIYKDGDSINDIARTGSLTTHQINPGDSVTSTTTVDVPSDADIVIIVVGGNGLSGMDVLNWDGGSGLDFTHIESDSKVTAYYMKANHSTWPGSGSHDLYWSPLPYALGLNVAVFFYKNVDISGDPILSTDLTGANVNSWTSSLSSVGSRDMAIVAGVTLYPPGADVDPATYGQTAIWESSIFNSSHLGVAEKVGDSSLYVYEGNNYLRAIAFALKSLDPIYSKPYTLELSGGLPRFEIYQGGVEYSIIGSTMINDDTWHLLKGVYDGGEMRIYVDGGLDGVNTSPSGNLDSSLMDVYLGKNFSSGYIDDIKIWHYPTTASQSETEYNRGAVGF